MTYKTRLMAVREIALRDAVDAVARAQRVVVTAAKALHATDLRDSYPAERDVRTSVHDLLEAEHIEAEARAKLEALR